MISAPFPAAAVGGDDLLSRPIVLVVALAVVSAPAVRVHGRHRLRQDRDRPARSSGARSAQSVPSSSTVIMALAGALTLIAMAPVGDKIVARATPLFAKDLPDTVTLVREGMGAVVEPMREFLRANASEVERARFLDVARTARPPESRASVGADDLTVLVPAFVVTELTEAFAIGFLVYLPLPRHRPRRRERPPPRAQDANDEPHPGELAVQAAPLRRDRRVGAARAVPSWRGTGRRATVGGDPGRTSGPRQ